MPNNIPFSLHIAISELRPVIRDGCLPTEENESIAIKIMMESCWSEHIEDRPSFADILGIFEVLSPLKGSQTERRALLLQRFVFLLMRGLYQWKLKVEWRKIPVSRRCLTSLFTSGGGVQYVVFRKLIKRPPSPSVNLQVESKIQTSPKFSVATRFFL